ncbi:MAG: LVIVD repeat-containing protein [Promethearchaeota archaeon]
MAKKRKPKYISKKKKKLIETEKKEKRTIEEKFYWAKVLSAVVTSLLAVLVFNLRGWWMLLYLAGFMLVWPFIQSFLIFRLPYKKDQWDWKQILKTGVGAFFFIFMLVSTASFTLLTYSDYKDQLNNPADTNDIIIQNNTAYIADGQNGFLIIDIENYNNRDLLGKYHYTGISALFIEKSGDLLFGVDNGTSILILDVSNPSEIEMLGEYLISNQINNILLDGENLFVSTEGDGLVILDISEPANIPEPLRYSSNHSISSLVLKDDLIFISDKTDRELQVWNGTNLSALSEISTIPITNDTFVDFVFNDDNLLFLSTENHGLIVYDFTNITNPVEHNSIEFAIYGQEILLYEDILILNSVDNGTFFIDISDPLDLVNMTTIYDSLGSANGLFIDGEYLFIADGVRGLDRVYIPEPRPSPIADNASSSSTVPFGWQGIAFSFALIPLIALYVKKRMG